MTTYSRTQTNDRNRQRKNKRKRRLMALNLAMLACIVAVAAIIWMVRRDEPATAGKEASGPSASASADATSTPVDSGGTDEPAGTAESEPDGEEAGASAGTDEDDAEAGGDGAEATEGDGQVTLALVGDILPAARVLDYMNQFGFDYPFRETSGLLQAADIAAGNLETSITTRGTPEEDKQYVYRAPQETLAPIKEAGFDFLSLANNHTLDYGWEGLSDTMDALDDADLVHAGAGIDDREAYTPAYIDSKGMTVGFVGLTRVVPDTSWKADKNNPGLAEAYSTARAVAAIKEAREHADVVVVMVHWGEERKDLPNEFQKSLAYAFVDAGADLVVGSHPHVLQGFESYKGKWIAYSLGNFVFPGMSPPTTAETGILTATCKPGGDCSLRFAPMISKLAQPVPMEAETGKALLARLSSISFGAKIEEDGTIVASSP
ncbi:CapA family protein [Cohnella sp. GCM10027633]|uniref:CapA family protein n=1 Tax=unclassified Cohnella TaxID=2636738 RepID=UPI00362B1578